MIRSSIVVLGIIVGTAPSLASDSAVWLTATDIQTDLPGLRVEEFLNAQEGSFCSPQAPGYESVPDLRCLRWASAPATDADGSIYFTTSDTGIHLPPRPSAIWRTRRDGSTERVAHIGARMLPSGGWATGSFLGFVLDSPRGYLYAQFRSSCPLCQHA